MTAQVPSSAYRLAPLVAVVEGTASDDGPAPVYVAPLPHGPIAVLEDAAAVIWRAATASTTVDWVEAAAAAMGGTAQEAGEEIRRFAQDLVVRGLLVPSDAPDAADA